MASNGAVAADAHAHLDRHGAVAVLRLDRPAVHNVVGLATIDRLEALLDELDGWQDVVVLVLTGTGEKTFCAGSDLGDLATVDDREAALDMSPRMQGILDRLDRGPRVTLAALNGSAYGGGCELLTACHLRIAAAGSRFSFRQAKMGVSTGWGGGGRLFRLVGRSHALRLLLTADTISADEALRIGLVDQVVPGDRVLDETLELAQRIAGNHPPSLAAFLALANLADQETHNAILAEERRLFGELWRDNTFWENVEAWKVRRQQARAED